VATLRQSETADGEYGEGEVADAAGAEGSVEGVAGETMP
jgi:hypothetical protein